MCVRVCILLRLCVQFRTNKLIYRRYAGLFFTICCDVTDNELVTLEAIHLFVEILDQYFQNVCELDLVFNFHKVYLILDEFIIGGEFQETSKKVRTLSSHDTHTHTHTHTQHEPISHGWTFPCPGDGDDSARMCIRVCACSW